MDSIHYLKVIGIAIFIIFARKIHYEAQNTKMSSSAVSEKSVKMYEYHFSEILTLVMQYNLSIVELLVAGKFSTNHRFSTIQLVIFYIKKQMKQKIRPLFTGFSLFSLTLFTGYTVLRYTRYRKME